jgi:hypothetical protein
MRIDDNPLGVSGTTLSGLGDQNGALYQFLKQTSGGSSNAQRAIDLAGQLVPQYQEVNPWEVAFQYFAEMGRQASQPGATAFGAAVGSMQVPLDYLNAKKKEKRESDSARLQTALTLGPSLKPDAGKVTYRPATAAELAQYGATAGQMGSDGKFYDLGKTASTAGNDLKPFGLIDSSNLAEIQRIIPTASVDADGNVLLTDTEAAKAGVRQYIGPKITPGTESESGSSSPIAKLYDDLEKAVVGSPEAVALQSEIDALVTKSGFDKELFDAENKILDSWTKATSSMNESEINYNKMVEAVASADGPGDLALVFSFMKMLDPGSVVRESEFSAAQNTAGLFQKLLVAAENIKKGDLLSDDQRKSFLALSEKFLIGGREAMAKIRRNKGLQAKGYGLNAANIFGYEPAPAQWYISDDAYEMAKAAGVGIEAVWLNKTPAEQAAWLAENGG